MPGSAYHSQVLEQGTHQGKQRLQVLPHPNSDLAIDGVNCCHCSNASLGKMVIG